MRPSTFRGLDCRAEAGATEAEIVIYGPIGPAYWGATAVSASAVREFLAKLDSAVKTIHVYVNSPGGDAFDGQTIYNLLMDQRRRFSRSVKVRIDALAASAATLVTAAGDEINIYDNALMMIHESWTIAVGGATDLTKTAQGLGHVDDSMVVTYGNLTKKPEDEIRAMLAAETWFDAQEAVAAGFATTVLKSAAGSGSAQACLDLGAGGSLAVPDRYRNRINAPGATFKHHRADASLDPATIYRSRAAVTRATEHAPTGQPTSAASVPGAAMPNPDDVYAARRQQIGGAA